MGSSNCTAAGTVPAGSVLSSDNTLPASTRSPAAGTRATLPCCTSMVASSRPPGDGVSLASTSTTLSASSTTLVPSGVLYAAQPEATGGSLTADTSTRTTSVWEPVEQSGCWREHTDVAVTAMEATPLASLFQSRAGMYSMPPSAAFT